MVYRVGGEIRVGEANRTIGRVRRRLLGLRPGIALVMIACWGACSTAGWFLDDQTHRLFDLNLDADRSAGLWAGFLVGAFLAVRLASRLTVRDYRAKLARRGTPGVLPTSCEITPDALVYRVGGVTQSALWSAVSELFQVDDYWVFIAQGHSFYVPRRNFKTPEAERAFIAAALEQMDASARQRSDTARRLLAAA